MVSSSSAKLPQVWGDYSKISIWRTVRCQNVSVTKTWRGSKSVCKNRQAMWSSLCTTLQICPDHPRKQDILYFIVTGNTTSVFLYWVYKCCVYLILPSVVATQEVDRSPFWVRTFLNDLEGQSIFFQLLFLSSVDTLLFARKQNWMARRTGP